MPKIGEVDGITIRMFYNDHAPPHFHALAGEHEILVSVAEVRVIAGTAPRAMVRKVLAWASLRQSDLALNWVLCEQGLKPRWIA